MVIVNFGLMYLCFFRSLKIAEYYAAITEYYTAITEYYAAITPTSYRRGWRELLFWAPVLWADLTRRWSKSHNPHVSA